MSVNLKQQRRCRREKTNECKNKFYEMLSKAQLYSIGKLNIFGYELSFVRTEGMKAYLKQEEKYAMVLPDGKIDFNPDCNIR
jgi:hypothetical protein